MKLRIKGLFLSLLLTVFACANSPTTHSPLESGFGIDGWEIKYDAQERGVDIYRNSKLICANVYASYKLHDTEVSSRDYSKCKVAIKKVRDVFGMGYLYQLTYTDKAYPTLVQSFYIYPARGYILTDFTLESRKGVSSDYMAPVNIAKMPELLVKGENNRALFIPFDNDKWIRYSSCPLTFDKLISYEVTAIFNNDSREALVIGSVEHDTWKTAVSMGKCTANNTSSLSCYGGVADEQTRDSKSHGAIQGKKIKSPKILIGFFSDWRDGMEEYAKANALVAPPREWAKAIPFGWNSWGVLQFNMTAPKVLEVSDFFKANLQNNFFKNPEGTVYIGLDSGWNGFKEEDLKAFVDRCKSNGQKAGAYWTPFTDWGCNPENIVDGNAAYKYKDIYLYANGKPQELDGAFALDPTHPAVEASMKKMSDLLRRLGFEYVKMDFMTHGAMEADKWYRANISTGIQGYNYGMQLLDKYFSYMYINLSISPIFPAQYGQSRRIACDAWNKIKDTEYTMNALSYGWWQNFVYQYNDADHIVLRGATEGENRARITSGVITGIYMVGDDYSAGGEEEGKAKSRKFLTNPRVNAVATGVAFRPVEGNGVQSEREFIRKDADGTYYYAVFNYSENVMEIAVPLSRIGLDASTEYRATELWSGKESSLKNMLRITVPSQDAFLFKIN